MAEVRDVVIGGMYKHFKNHIVKVLDVAFDSETENEMVVYWHDGKTWVRPKEMFLSKVDKEKYPEVQQEYRFELIPDYVKPAYVIQKAISGRQTGKTHKLIRMSADNKTPIVVRNQEEVRLLKAMAMEEKLNIPEPINIISRILVALGGDTLPQVDSVIVDDADYVLKSILSRFNINSISAIAISTEGAADEVI